MVINCSNSLGQGDPKYEQHIGNISCDKKGRHFMLGYSAIRIYFGLFGVPDFTYAWSTDPLKRMSYIPKTMPYNEYAMIKKHFQVTIQKDLPNRKDADYHPMQNVKSGNEVLWRQISRALVCWKRHSS